MQPSLLILDSELPSKMKKFLTTLIFTSILIFTNLSADSTHFIDFSKVLNESDAGKKAQVFLKKKLETESKKFKKQEEDLRKEESQLISQKKLITNEEYQKKVESLRKKVASLQKNKQESFNDIANKRNKARSELLKKLNPIIKKYMEEKKIRLVIDKKAVLLGDTNLEITSEVIKELNKELKSLNLN